MTRSSLPLAPTLLLLAALGLQSCNDSGPSTYGQRDKGVSPPIGQFLDPCQQDSDCVSARCLPFGPGKRCSRTCNDSTPCPALTGWSCSPQTTCICSYTGKQPSACNTDGDCDGEPDKLVQPETCNGEDDDCNGKIDDVAPNTPGAKLYYRDSDGDGYGDQEGALWSCKPPAGYVENKSDCNDSRKDINPAAVEVCGDGLDHDCDGFTWDADVCGVLPIIVPDVNDPVSISGTLKVCGSGGLDASVDITEIVAKQDTTLIKFTVRLAGAPALASCASYVLRLGSFSKAYDMAYVYRPATTACAAQGLPELDAYLKGSKVATKAAVGFNASAPGHVFFTIPKSEFFPSVTTPSYYVKACTNAKADAVKDITDCGSDSCETPVRRE